MKTRKGRLRKEQPFHTNFPERGFDKVEKSWEGERKVRGGGTLLKKVSPDNNPITIKTIRPSIRCLPTGLYGVRWPTRTPGEEQARRQAQSSRALMAMPAHKRFFGGLGGKLLYELRSGGHVLRHPDVAADDRTAADGDAAEDGRPGVHGDVVLKNGMAGNALTSTPSPSLGNDSAPRVTP